MMLKIWVALFLGLFAIPSYAAGTIIAVTVLGLTAGSFAAVATAFAINMVLSAVITKAFFTPNQPDSGGGGGSGSSPDPGNRQQVPPATNNKLPVVYGTAYVGGTIVDLSISSDNQTLYYVLAISEVTNTNTGQTPDNITFGNVYYGGKKVIFGINGAKFNPLATVSSVGSNSVTCDDLGSPPAVGTSVTFSNGSAPNVYTVQSVSGGTYEFEPTTVTFTTSISGVSTGNTMYQYVYESNNSCIVTGLLDESTGIVDSSVNGKIRIYLYSNGSNAPYNSSSNAISVMSASNLIYKWNSTKLMTNCAFAIIQLQYSQSANIRGIEQTKFQVSNSRYLPGDCITDYLINTRYGAAIPATQIDSTSMQALNVYSAQPFAYTDYEGTTTYQPRFLFNGTVDTDRNIMDNLQDMASCCDCLIKYNEITAKWGAIVQSPAYTIAMEINDSNVTSAISVTPLDIAASYNVVETKYPDKTNQDSFNSATLDLQQVNPLLLYPNEPVNKASISLPFTNNDVTAQYISNRILKSGREDLQIQLDVNFVGIQLDAGDVVSVTNTNYGWVNKLFRLVKVTQTFTDTGAINVKLVMSEFNPAVYDDVNITQFTPAANTGIGDPLFFGSIPAPVVYTQYPTATNPSFLVQVTTASSGITQYAEVWYSAFQYPTNTQLIFAGTSQINPDGNPWGVSTVLPSILLSDIPSGDWYLFARMVNSLGSSPFSLASTKFKWRPSTFQYTERYLVVAYADSITGSGFNLNPRTKSYYGLLNQDNTTPSTNPSEYTWYLADPAFGSANYLAYSNRTGRKFSFDTGLAGYAAGTGAFVPTQASLFDPRAWAALPDGTNYIDLDHTTGQVLQTGTTTVGLGEIDVVNNQDGKVVASLRQYLDFGAGIYSKTASVASLTIDIYGRVVGFTEPDDFYFSKESFTATSGQTVFTVTRSSGYISGQCFVFKNGLLLDESEYTDTGGSTGTVTLATGATTGEIISIVSFKSSNTTTGVYASFSRYTANLTNASTYTASGFTLDSGFELLFLNGTVVNENDYNIVGQDITDFPTNATGLLTIIQWTPNNLTVPNGNPVNVVTNTIIGQTNYPFSYDANAFNLYDNGVLLKQGTDYSTATGGYNLTNTPTTNTMVLVQQTFARTGAV